VPRESLCQAVSFMRIFVKKKGIYQRDEKEDLVNNAGINIRKAAVEYSEEEYQKIIGISLTTPFLLSRKLYPFLKKSGNASIINVSSVSGVMDTKTGSPYGMSKAGLIMQTKKSRYRMGRRRHPRKCNIAMVYRNTVNERHFKIARTHRTCATTHAHGPNRPSRRNGQRHCFFRNG